MLSWVEHEKRFITSRAALSFKQLKGYTKTLDSPAAIVKSHLFLQKGKVMKLWTQGKFGHTFVNSGNPDETAPYEPSH